MSPILNLLLYISYDCNFILNLDTCTMFHVSNLNYMGDDYEITRLKIHGRFRINILCNEIRHAIDIVYCKCVKSLSLLTLEMNP